MNYTDFYCYTKNGKPDVKREKPEGFEKLPDAMVKKAPSRDIAERCYVIDLKIKRM